MEICFLRASVCGGDPDQNVFWPSFGILNLNIEITVFIKDSSVNKFVFRLRSIATAVFFPQLFVWELLLRVFVKRF